MSELPEKWWSENRERLLKIYNTELDPNMAVLRIAEIVWRYAMEKQAEG